MSERMGEMNRADLEKAISTLPTMRGTLVACVVVSIAWHVVVGDPWAQLPIRLAFSCACGALICWCWQRLTRR